MKPKLITPQPSDDATVSSKTTGQPQEAPGIMPIDRQAWASKLGLCNFVNAYYQLRDLEALPAVKRVLLIGPGQGLDPVVLRWRGFDVLTFDVDTTFAPDVLGSVHDMHMFSRGTFDAVLVSHVLEHLPLPLLDKSLSEIARVGKHAVIYLPVNGVHLQLRLSSNFRNWDWSRILDVRKWWRRPDDTVARFMSGQHFWEVGLAGCRKADIVQAMEAHFKLEHVYRNQDWQPSLNFLLVSRQHGLQS